MPLSMLGLGTNAVVTGLSGKLEFKKLLSELGFVVGKQVEIIQYTIGNNIVFGIGGARLALDKSMAHCVQILPGSCKS